MKVTLKELRDVIRNEIYLGRQIKILEEDRQETTIVENLDKKLEKLIEEVNENYIKGA